MKTLTWMVLSVSLLAGCSTTRGNNSVEENAMQFEESITVNVDIEEAYAFLISVENIPKWHTAIEAATLKTPDQLGGGSEIEIRRKLLFREFTDVVHVKSLIPMKEMELEITEGPTPLAYRYVLEKLSDGNTRLSIEARWEIPSYGFILSPFLKRAIPQGIRTNLSLFKKIVESQYQAPRDAA